MNGTETCLVLRVGTSGTTAVPVLGDDIWQRETNITSATSYDTWLSAVCAEIRSMRTRTGATRVALLLPATLADGNGGGDVTIANFGRMYRSWIGRQPRRDLTEATDMPVLVCTLAEALRASELAWAPPPNNLLAVTWDYNLGAAHATHSGINGNMLLGHLPSHQEAPQCWCGVIGCLDVVIGGEVLGKPDDLLSHNKHIWAQRIKLLVTHGIVPLVLTNPCDRIVFDGSIISDLMRHPELNLLTFIQGWMKARIGLVDVPAVTFASHRAALSDGAARLALQMVSR